MIRAVRVEGLQSQWPLVVLISTAELRQGSSLGGNVAGNSILAVLELGIGAGVEMKRPSAGSEVWVSMGF
jgi:hypothetical protein